VQSQLHHTFYAQPTTSRSEGHSTDWIDIQLPVNWLSNYFTQKAATILTIKRPIEQNRIINMDFGECKFETLVGATAQETATAKENPMQRSKGPQLICQWSTFISTLQLQLLRCLLRQ